jgi:hypothetical protein
MARLRRLGAIFAAKLVAILAALLGVTAGILYSFGGFFWDLFTGTLNSGTALAFLALLGMPAIFAAFGFVAGAIGAVLYNMALRRIRGIHVDLDHSAE